MDTSYQKPDQMKTGILKADPIAKGRFFAIPQFRFIRVKI